MRSLVVFAKYPEAGSVKTRLARAIGPERAAAVARSLLTETIGRLRNSGLDPVLYGKGAPRGDFAQIVGGGIRMEDQRGKDLGEALAAAFESEFLGGRDRVAVIGSDSPDLPLDLIEEAFGRLWENDLVLGPARDGGYYLIGLSGPAPELFRGIPWSTDKVLDSTLETARRLGLSFSLLSPWRDIDTIEDYEDYLSGKRG